jgi:hypothetical protein
MEININWLTVILATLAGMAVAMVWYSNWGLFAKPWEKQTGITREKLRKAQGRKPFIILFVANFAAALVLTIAITVTSKYFNDDSIWLALAVGCAAWLGLSATTLWQHNTFEMKSNRLTAINNGYQLALFLAMALVVGLLQ